MQVLFYDNSIFSGTKIDTDDHLKIYEFYDNSIFSGTKIPGKCKFRWYRFTITQFFQVLK